MRPRTLILNRRSHRALSADGRCLVPLDQVEPYLVTHAYGGVEGLDAAEFPNVYVVDVRDPGQVRAICEWLIRHEGVDRVVALQERSVLPAARLRSDFGLPGTSYETALRFRDKVVMKQVASCAGILVPRFALIESGADFDELGWTADRWVLKATDGEGGSNVHVRESLTECRALWQKLHGTGTNFEIEEFVKGDIYHCDGVWQEGTLRFCAVSKYIGRPNEYAPGGFLASYVVPESDLTVRMQAFVGEVLAALGLVSGVCHLELFLRGEQLVLCEVACRPAGGLIPQAVRSRYGLELLTAAITAEAGVELPAAAELANDVTGLWGWVGVFSRSDERRPVPAAAHRRLGVSEHWSGPARSRAPAHCTDYAEGYVFRADNEDQWLSRLHELTAGVA